jgi:hypothetical protein
MANIPNEVVEYVLGIMELYEYSDNIRIADESNKEQVAEYERIRAKGCCGFMDYQRFHWCGKCYVFGFNYGH